MWCDSQRRSRGKFQLPAVVKVFIIFDFCYYFYCKTLVISKVDFGTVR